jgi:hypothetical protein
MFLAKQIPEDVLNRSGFRTITYDIDGVKSRSLAFKHPFLKLDERGLKSHLSTTLLRWAKTDDFVDAPEENALRAGVNNLVYFPEEDEAILISKLKVPKYDLPKNLPNRTWYELCSDFYHGVKKHWKLEFILGLFTTASLNKLFGGNLTKGITQDPYVVHNPQQDHSNTSAATETFAYVNTNLNGTATDAADVDDLEHRAIDSEGIRGDQPELKPRKIFNVQHSGCFLEHKDYMFVGSEDGLYKIDKNNHDIVASYDINTWDLHIDNKTGYVYTIGIKSNGDNFLMKFDNNLNFIDETLISDETLEVIVLDDKIYTATDFENPQEVIFDKNLEQISEGRSDSHLGTDSSFTIYSINRGEDGKMGLKIVDNKLNVIAETKEKFDIDTSDTPYYGISETNKHVFFGVTNIDDNFRPQKSELIIFKIQGGALIEVGRHSSGDFVPLGNGYVLSQKYSDASSTTIDKEMLDVTDPTNIFVAQEFKSNSDVLNVKEASSDRLWGRTDSNVGVFQSPSTERFGENDAQIVDIVTNQVDQSDVVEILKGAFDDNFDPIVHIVDEQLYVQIPARVMENVEDLRISATAENSGQVLLFDLVPQGNNLYRADVQIGRYNPKVIESVVGAKGSGIGHALDAMINNQGTIHYGIQMHDGHKWQDLETMMTATDSLENSNVHARSTTVYHQCPVKTQVRTKDGHIVGFDNNQELTEVEGSFYYNGEDSQFIYVPTVAVKEIRDFAKDDGHVDASHIFEEQGDVTHRIFSHKVTKGQTIGYPLTGPLEPVILNGNGSNADGDMTYAWATAGGLATFFTITGVRAARRKRRVIESTPSAAQRIDDGLEFNRYSDQVDTMSYQLFSDEELIPTEDELIPMDEELIPTDEELIPIDDLDEPTPIRVRQPTHTPLGKKEVRVRKVKRS